VLKNKIKRNMKYLSLTIICTVLLLSCNYNNKKVSTKMGITEKTFGNFERKAVKEYTLTNANGMEVGIINYGGTITKIITADKDGNKADVVTGFESLDGFLQKGVPYFGALIGRYGNRIANATFTLDGAKYTLAANNNGNNLHGGNNGYDKVYWAIEKLAGDSSLKLNYLSKDGEEGFPGNLNIEVIYTLSADNTLTIQYKATSDKATPVNLTSHAYFNLSGGKDSTILAHELMIKADKFTAVNDLLIPTGKLDAVKGGTMDFTTSKLIGKDIDKVIGGYDHNWVLNKNGTSLEMVAELYHPASGRKMEVFTTEPGLQFYSGNFLDGTLTNSKGGIKYIKHGALCLEAQHFPDSPNQPNFPSTILKPGEIYTQTTAYKFSTK
jgi:aldose 1-epimerase